MDAISSSESFKSTARKKNFKGIISALHKCEYKLFWNIFNTSVYSSAVQNFLNSSENPSRMLHCSWILTGKGLKHFMSSCVHSSQWTEIELEGDTVMVDLDVL